MAHSQSYQLRIPYAVAKMYKETPSELIASFFDFNFGRKSF